jgi:DNA-binding IclR family transcriptional regulator
MTRVTDDPVRREPASQTLDRGLRVLDHVASSSHPLTTAELVRRVGLHRSITYRMLRTLEDWHLVSRDPTGAWVPGTGLPALAANVAPDIRDAAEGVLVRLADECAMTAFVVVRDDDEVVTVSVVEPRSSAAHVAYRPGRRHPISRGAPGLALLSGRGPLPHERPEVALARDRGWAWSESEVLPGMQSVAAPVLAPDRECDAAIAVVFVGTPDREELARRIVRAARELEERLRRRDRAREKA